MDFFKKNNTSRYPTDILIGELFVKAGVISQKQLDDTVRSAGAKHLHIGQMLVMSGFIKQRDIEFAVDAQSLLRDKVVDMAMAARCLKIAVKTGASVVELVKEEQAIGAASTQTNRLGELLMESGLINRGQLSAAMQRSMSTGLPLGRILVLNNSIVDPLLRFALELQVRVRDEMIDRAEAIDTLRAEATKLGMKIGYYDEKPSDSQVNLKPLKQKVVRLGELLVSAQFLNETDVMSCLELGLLTERPIGEVMVEQGYISPDMLTVALTVQQMVEEGVYSKEEAGQVLMQVRETNVIIPAIQDRIDGNYDKGSNAGYNSADNYDNGGTGDPFNESYAGSEQGYDQQVETIAPGSGGGNGYDMSADLKEFDSVVGAPKTGRHDSSRGGQRESRQAPVTASNFEEAPSLESLMAAVSGGDSTGVESGNMFASLESEFTESSADSSVYGNGHDTAEAISASSMSYDAAASDQNLFINDASAAPVLTPAPAYPFEALLLAANVVSVKDIEHAFEQARTNPLLMVEVLHQTGFLTTVGRTASLDCFNLITAGQFDQTQGAQLLDHCINQGRLRNLTLDDAMSELGLSAMVLSAADAAAPVPNALSEETFAESVPQPAVAEEPQPLSVAAPNELVIDSLIAEVKEPEVEAKSEDADLLQLFGLHEGTAADSQEALAKSAQTGSAAESLMASLQPVSETTAAMEEAAATRPEAFQTTAVFKSIAESELESATSVVGEEPGSSLDTLLQRLESNLGDSADEPGLVDFGLESIKATDTDKAVDKVTEIVEKPLNGSTSAAASTGLANEDLAKDDVEVDLLLGRLNELDAKNNGADDVIEGDSRVTEEVDLRSLFSSLTGEQAKRGGASDKPLAASAAPRASEKLSFAADTPAPPPAPVAPSAVPTPLVSPAPAAASSSPQAASMASAPSTVVQAEPTPAAPAALSESFASPVAPSPVAAAPAPAPVAAAPAPAPVAEAPAPAPVAPAPAPSPVTAAPAPAPVTAAPAPSPVAAAPAPSTVTAAPAPAPVAATPAPQPSSTSADAEPKPKPTASNSKLPTMSEEELRKAKKAQISAMATALTKMAEMHYETANYPEAQKAYERILSWRQGELGSNHIDLVDDLNNLAGVMCVQELFDQAEPMIRRAVEILEGAEVLEPLRLAENLTSLAGLQFRLGGLEKAEPLLARSLMLREQELGPDHTDLADALRDYAKLLKKIGRAEDAEQYYSRAKILIARRKSEEG